MTTYESLSGIFKDAYSRDSGEDMAAIKDRLRNPAYIHHVVGRPTFAEDENIEAMAIAATHIDAQDAKIKALVEALEVYACECDPAEGKCGVGSTLPCGGFARSALAAAKETT